MTASTSPFASHIARLLAHKRALGMAYHREQWFLAEFERATTTWPDSVLSEAVVRMYLSEKTDGVALTVSPWSEPSRGFSSWRSHEPSCRRHGSSASGGGDLRPGSCPARRLAAFY